MRLWGKKENVVGYIAHFNLADWWFSTFTDEERKYIDDCYQPMGLPPHTLTRGDWTSSKPVTQFLNELSTWFSSKKDASIADHIHEKIVELGRTNPIEKPGYYEGRHFTTYVNDIKALKQSGQFDAAEDLLVNLVSVIEEEGESPAPWYYEELAKIYRKRKDYVKEVSILERFAKQKQALGAKSQKLIERLEKAQQLVESRK